MVFGPHFSSAFSFLSLFGLLDLRCLKILFLYSFSKKSFSFRRLPLYPSSGLVWLPCRCTSILIQQYLRQSVCLMSFLRGGSIRHYQFLCSKNNNFVCFSLLLLLLLTLLVTDHLFSLPSFSPVSSIASFSTNHFHAFNILGFL